MTNPAVPDLRTLAAEGIPADLVEEAARAAFDADQEPERLNVWEDIGWWAQQAYRDRARAGLAAVLPAHRQQIIGELERPDSPLCDCSPDENTPTSPQTGQPMDHHCDCQAVRTASTLLGANSLTRHAQECGHGTRFDEFYRPAATTPPARQDSPGTTGQAGAVPEPGPEPVYRVGRKVGRTIYRHDVLIGVMDTPELAALAVEAMNRAEEDTDAA